jgi:hypothetical protein
MWHAFSVLFRVGASLGLRHGRNPRLVCGAHSGHFAALRPLDPAATHDPANEKPKHTQAPTVLWACSPQRHMTPHTQTQAHAYANRAVACSPQHMTPHTQTQAHAGAKRAAGLQPAAAHDPANEKTKHTHTPTVLWACSPQRHMTPHTQTQAHAYAKRAAGLQPAAAHDPAYANPSTRIRQPCCGLQPAAAHDPAYANPSTRIRQACSGLAARSGT